MVGYQCAVRLAYRPQEPFARFGQCNALHPASVKRPSRGAKTDAVRQDQEKGIRSLQDRVLLVGPAAVNNV